MTREPHQLRANQLGTVSRAALDLATAAIDAGDGGHFDPARIGRLTVQVLTEASALFGSSGAARFRQMCLDPLALTGDPANDDVAFGGWV